MQNFTINDIVEYKFDKDYYFFDGYETVDKVKISHIFTEETKVVKEKSIKKVPDYIYHLCEMVKEEQINTRNFYTFIDDKNKELKDETISRILESLKEYCITATQEELDTEWSRVEELSKIGPTMLEYFEATAPYISHASESERKLDDLRKRIPNMSKDEIVMELEKLQSSNTSNAYNKVCIYILKKIISKDANCTPSWDDVIDAFIEGTNIY